MKKTIGRPPLAEKIVLAEVFSVRLRTDEARDVTNAVNSSGQTKADWLRAALLAAARKKK